MAGLYNFGNLTESFMNQSRDIPSQTPEKKVFNITGFAGFNNSKQGYVNHYFNFTDANATFVQPCDGRSEAPTCIESIWVGSLWNLSYNTTAIYTNWTI